MNILHYSLGVFPERSGGLVRYSTDLAFEQGKTNNVYYLHPGKLGIIDKKTKIVYESDINNVHIYKINNALPIPIYAGIKNVSIYTHPINPKIYENFLIENSIETIHIHSLMGLHIELLRVAKELSIPVFYTSHDYFGLCPITTLYRNNCICNCLSINSNCAACSINAYSYIKLSFGQSRVYRLLKSNKFVSVFRKRALTNDPITQVNVSTVLDDDYILLNNYYIECFSLIDWFFFNSFQSKDVYMKRLGNVPGEVTHILLPSIKDIRKERTFLKDGILHVGFMGDCNEFKGYYHLESAISKLKASGYRIELDVFSDNVVENSYVKKCGRYLSSDLEIIYESLDLVVVPSLWQETFSFIAVEALSAAMPCIVSNRVGAKDLIKDGYTGLVFDADKENAILDCLERVLKDAGILSKINNNIINDSKKYSFFNHCSYITNKYRKFLER